MSGKIAAQNDEQAKHGKHDHSHNTANHCVVHSTNGALFTCSRVCENQKRNRDVELITRHQEPQGHCLQGQEVTFFFNGGVSKNKPAGSSYTEGTD